jgi:hypothetical protein
MAGDIPLINKNNNNNLHYVAGKKRCVPCLFYNKDGLGRRDTGVILPTLMTRVVGQRTGILAPWLFFFSFLSFVFCFSLYSLGLGRYPGWHPAAEAAEHCSGTSLGSL